MHGFGSTTPRLVCAWLQITDHQPHARTDCVDDTKLSQYTVFKKFATMGTRLPSESPEKKRDQKLYLQPTCTTQDVITSMSGSAVKRAAERPPVTAKGVPEKRKPFLGSVPIPGSRCSMAQERSHENTDKASLSPTRFTGTRTGTRDARHSTKRDKHTRITNQSVSSVELIHGIVLTLTNAS